MIDDFNFSFSNFNNSIVCFNITFSNVCRISKFNNIKIIFKSNLINLMYISELEMFIFEIFNNSMIILMSIKII